MAKQSISSPALRRDETIVGWGYYAFQILLLPGLLSEVLPLISKRFTPTEVNFTYFLINFLASIWIYHKFLAGNLKTVKAHPALFCQAIILALVAYWASFRGMNWCLAQLDSAFVNKNDASIVSMAQGNYYLMLLGTGILAPVAEECVFRGLVFRNLYKTSQVAAYLISMAAFSMIHILGYLGVYSTLHVVLAFLQYLPAGLCLGWCYVKSGTIYGPIVMHAIINLYSLNLLR